MIRFVGGEKECRAAFSSACLARSCGHSFIQPSCVCKVLHRLKKPFAVQTLVMAQAQPLDLARITLYKNNLAFCVREGKIGDSRLAGSTQVPSQQVL